ncbi:MAG TPA: hypothetical protein VE687_17930, partial [Stellaceae bacterium]|nr:hypothetical protein [Stellaceae bacterium]
MSAIGRHHDLKNLSATSFDARFLAAACCSRSISAFNSAMRSLSSSTDSNDKSWPISWVTFFRGRSSSSMGMGYPFAREGLPDRLPAEAALAKQMPLHIRTPFEGQIMEKLPAQMTVIGISKPGGPEVLKPETRAVPKPAPDEILV